MFPTHANEAYERRGSHHPRPACTRPITELGGSPIVDILSYKPVANSATQSRDRMLQGYDPQSSDARALLAAARFAFETSPTGYVERGVEARVLRVIDEAQDESFRRGNGRAAGPPGPQPPAGGPAVGGSAVPSARDADLASQLFDRLATLRSGSP